MITNTIQYGQAHRPYVDTGTVTNAFNNFVSSLSASINDHASRIDALQNTVLSLVDVVTWVSEAHPEVLHEYKAIKDIERWSK